MVTCLTLSSTILLVAIVLCLSPGVLSLPEEDEHHHYSNLWVIKIRGPREAAQQVARELGYSNRGELLGFDNYYLLEKRSVPKKSKRSSHHWTTKLQDHPTVEWAEQMIEKRRDKRGIPYPQRFHPFQHKHLFNDPLWDKQWYMHDTRAQPNLPKIDLDVPFAWEMGYTGKGVVVTIIDDGLEWNHTDLIRNYDPDASWDVNDNDADPMARHDSLGLNAHGTRCAGEVAMVANNKKCGVGVAFDSKIGGIRMLDGSVTDASEGVALGFNVTHIDIYSASWGPTDDGKTVEGPGKLAQQALEKGITKGRNGKGVLYIWASGNGGVHGDNCNCDGYASSIYTLSVGSASQHGHFPWYGEVCASTMTSTYSSGAYIDQKISTADLKDSCTTEHTGTSASAPLAAGIYALVLEANKNITWRDAQHLAVWTSSYEPIKNNQGWLRNAQGFLYNIRFGFGLMNATSIVEAAKSWINVPKKHICRIPSETSLPLEVDKGIVTEISFASGSCKNNENEINYLEHAEVEATITTPQRGAMFIYLISPSGTKTILLTPRSGDRSIAGFKDWKFMSVHLWGENPRGKWILRIMDKGQKVGKGHVTNMTLILHGTKEIPHYLKNGPRKYKSEQDVSDLLERSIKDEPSGVVDDSDLKSNYYSTNSKKLFSNTHRRRSDAYEDQILNQMDEINQIYRSMVLKNSY